MPWTSYRELDEEDREEVIQHIDDVEQAGDIVDLLQYDEDTAGGPDGHGADRGKREPFDARLPEGDAPPGRGA